jgi:hypothetical protein
MPIAKALGGVRHSGDAASIQTGAFPVRLDGPIRVMGSGVNENQRSE